MAGFARQIAENNDDILLVAPPASHGAHIDSDGAVDLDPDRAGGEPCRRVIGEKQGAGGKPANARASVSPLGRAQSCVKVRASALTGIHVRRSRWNCRGEKAPGAKTGRRQRCRWRTNTSHGNRRVNFRRAAKTAAMRGAPLFRRHRILAPGHFAKILTSAMTVPSVAAV